MPPKSRDRETEAVEAEEAKASKRSRELFDAALDARLVSRVRPSSLTELKPSKVLKRSDCKDIHKRSSVKKSRYMTVFPGQLGNLKEGRLGSLAKLDTQNPVMYIEYPGFGRLKLCGTIVRSRTARYFTLNVKSKDRLNLEDWFDSMIVFSTCHWVGTAEANPGEEPMPFPEELKHVQAAAAKGSESSPEAEKPPPATLADFAFSVAAEEGAKPKTSVRGEREKTDEGPAARERTKDASERVDVSLDLSGDEDVDEDDRAAAAAAAAAAASRPSARPRRESAKAARYDFSEVDDFDLEEEEEEEEKVFRGRVTATVAKEAAPLAAPKRRSVAAAGAGAAKKAKSDAPAPRADPSEVVAISDDDDDDDGNDDAPPELRPAAGRKQTSLLGFLGGKKEAAAAAPPAVAAPKPSKKFVLDSESESESESGEEEEDSDFEA